MGPVPNQAELLDRVDPEADGKPDKPACLDAQVLEKQSEQQAINSLRISELENEVLLRKVLSWSFFIVSIAWLVAIVIMIWAQGTGSGGFDIDSSVIIAIVGGTTVTVFKMLRVVAEYIYRP